MKLGVVVILTLLFVGCSWCEPKVEYVDRVVKVNVPVKCKVPVVECDFNKDTDTEVIDTLVRCVSDLKKAEEVCK